MKLKNDIFNPAWLDDFILMFLFTESKGSLNYDIIKKARFKKVLRWHSSKHRLLEWEACKIWHQDTVSKIERQAAPVPGQRLVNREAVIKDHLEGKEDPVTAFLLGR